MTVLDGIILMTDTLLILFYVLQLAVIFVIDLFIPLGVAAGVPYVLPTLTTLWTNKEKDTYIVATGAALLTITGYFLSPVTDGVFWMVIANRLLALFVIFTTMIFVIKRKVSEKEIKILNHKLQQLADTDPLTKTGNRLLFNKVINDEMERAKRYLYPLSLLMLDIDYFKKINDSFGHDSGDKVLVSLTNLISEKIRKTDSLFRVGGEEFMVVLTGTDIENAKNVAESLCVKVSDYNIELMDGVTISVGVTSLLDNDTLESFMKRVDEAMYKSKETGRNRVTSLV